LTFVLAIFIAGTLSLPTYAPGTTPALHMSGLVPFLISIFVLTYVVLRYRFVDITPSIAAHQILHTMQSAVVVADMEGTIQIANGVAERLINLGSERLEGVSMRVILERVEDTCAESEQEEGIPYDVTLTQFDGSQRVLNVSRTSLRDRHGLLIGSVYVARDVTEVRRTERKLRQMALYDALTGLPNRVLFFDRLNQILARARRTGEQVAILFIDLDRFKSINDLYGHETGDTLLRETAERMVSCTRATDTIARVGGDEFIGICESISSPEDVDHIAGKIVEVLVRPFVIDGQSMNIGVSIGISIFPQDGIDQRALLAHADEAMYSVKSSRRSGFRLYSELVAERELPG
jgi:diguanylate cyclase (GGDEF)-like protein/PAS domain S-box-containing protein